MGFELATRHVSYPLKFVATARIRNPSAGAQSVLLEVAQFDHDVSLQFLALDGSRPTRGEATVLRGEMTVNAGQSGQRERARGIIDTWIFFDAVPADAYRRPLLSKGE